MSTGQVFGKGDLIPPPSTEAAGIPDVAEGGETNWLGSIDKIIRNIDGLFSHLIQIQEKYPQMVDKFKQLEGKKGNPGLPTGQTTKSTPSPEDIYAGVLNVLYELEQKNLTIAEVKKLAIQYKPMVLDKIRGFLGQ